MSYHPLAPAVVAALLLAAPVPPASSPAALPSRTGRLTCRATVPTPPAGTRRLDLWLPVPLADSSQAVRELQVEATQGPASQPVAVPYTIEADASGNRMVHLRVVAAKAFKPGQTFSLDNLSRQLDKVPPAPIAPITITLAILVTRHAQVPPYPRSPGQAQVDAVLARVQRETPVASRLASYVAACRQHGHAAQLVTGLVLPAGPGLPLRPATWVEVEIYPSAWLRVDTATPATQRMLDENRVALSYGQHLTLTPAQAGPPLPTFAAPYAEADGKPAKVTHQYAWVDAAQ